MKRPIYWAVLLAAAGVFLLIGYLLVGFLFFEFACTTETKLKIVDRRGFDIEVVEKDCDVIAKDALVRVYIAKTGDREKTLLFVYAPAEDNHGTILPAIRFDTATAMTIQIRVVGAVEFQRHVWDVLSIRYEIGRVISDEIHGKSSEP